MSLPPATSPSRSTPPSAPRADRRMLRDLSHPVRDRMMVYPGDPGVSIAPALHVDADGVAVGRIDMGSHTGTHVDAPAHTVRGGRTMAEVSLDELFGEALILRVPRAADGRTYGWGDLVVDGGIPETVPPIVVIDTGWARRFGDERALRHPALHPDAAKELVRRGMRVLAVDTLSPDLTEGSDGTFPRARGRPRRGWPDRRERVRARRAARPLHGRVLPPATGGRRSPCSCRGLPYRAGWVGVVVAPASPGVYGAPLVCVDFRNLE